MSITCQYDQLKYPFFMGDINKQISLEAKLRVTEGLPKITKIIGGDFRLEPPTFTIEDDLLIISGQINPQLIYTADVSKATSEDEPAEGEEEEQPSEYGTSWSGESGVNFEERIEIPGLRPEMIVEVELLPLTSNFEKSSSELVNFQGKIEAVVHSAYHQVAKIISDIAVQGPEKINQAKERVMVEELLDCKKVAFSIHQNLMIPSLKPGIARILKTSIKANALKLEVTRGRVFMRGFLEMSVVYVGCDDEGKPTEIFVNEWSNDAGTGIPFETHVDFEHEEGEVLTVPKVLARNIRFEIYSPHELRCFADLECEIRLSRLQQREMVADVTAEAGELIDTQRYLVNLEEHFGEMSGEVSLEQQLELPTHLANIERALMVQAFPREVSVEAAEGKVLIDGTCDLWLMYATDETEESKLTVASWDKYSNTGLPLTGVLEFPGLQPGTMLRTNVNLDSIRLEVLNDRTVKLNGTVNVKVFARSPRAFFILSDCALISPVDPSTRPSMLFYVIQPEDSLWKIARQYQTTVETLAKVNQIANPEVMEVGKKLFIPKQTVKV